MSEKKKNWGGKRLNAGRKPKGAAKAPSPTQTLAMQSKGKPVLRSKQTPQDKAKQRLGFKDYERRVGVTILDRSRHTPVQTPMILRGKTWIPQAGPIFRGAKATYQPYQQTDPYTDAYAGMDKFYKEYRRDDLVRGCIDASAYYATCKRFETVLEPTEDMEPEEAKTFVEQFKHVKDIIDKLNKKVDMDNMCYIALTNSSIFGAAVFEKVWMRGRDKSYKNLLSLLPLEFSLMQGSTARNGPNLDNDWNLTGYPYNYQDNFYEPDEILYFPNLALKADRVGLSDIEPIQDSIEARRRILEEAIPEAITVLWAGVGYISVNTEGLTDTEAETAVAAVEDAFKPGKYAFGNHKVDVTIVDLKPNLIQLNMTLEKLEQIIIGNFKTPPFIVGRERQVNRATAYAELEAYMNGPVAKKQQTLNRQLEAQWYSPLVREILGTPENEEPPVELKHVWNKFSTADFAELLNSITLAYAQGMGWIDIKKAYDLAGFDPNDLPKWVIPQTATPPPMETENIVTSKPYDTKEEAEAGLEDFRKTVQNAKIMYLAGRWHLQGTKLES